MNDEQLPDGLQLAIQHCSIGASEDRRNYIANAIRSEHAQRLTLQHHAADQAQRIAEHIEERDKAHQDAISAAVERDELRNRLTELEYARPVPAIPAGWKLVQVKSAEFDDLMYWLGRCDDKGHLENCPDLIEPWGSFEYRDVAAAPEAAR